jgi:hypothetical protein
LKPVPVARIENFAGELMGQLSSLIVVPTSQRGLLFPVIPDTQMRVLLDLDLPS